MRTEIRGYLFSIRMFQVRQASVEGGGRGYRREIKGKPTEVQTREVEEEEGGGGEREEEALLQLVCYISQKSMLKASLFSKESQNVSLSRERETHTHAHTRTEEIKPCTGQIHFEASARATWGLDTNLDEYFLFSFLLFFLSSETPRRRKLVSALRHVRGQWSPSLSVT